jgi:hypothetical protein
MEIDDLSHMYAEIVNGTPKADSQYARQSGEASDLWDTIAAEVADAKQQGWVAEIVNEIPDKVDQAALDKTD